jgi:hypothetical protein
VVGSSSSIKRYTTGSVKCRSAKGVSSRRMGRSSSRSVSSVAASGLSEGVSIAVTLLLGRAAHVGQDVILVRANALVHDGWHTPAR